ncbi:putative E3 ubiquitin-protein ligase HERC4 [Mustelus asterias]
MLRWGELSQRQLGSGTDRNGVLSQAIPLGEAFENEEIEQMCCGSQFSVFALKNSRVYTLVNDQIERGQPELVKELTEHKIHAMDSGTAHILYVSEAGNVFFSKLQRKKRRVNAKPFSITVPRLLRDLAEMCVIQVACGNSHSLALCKDGRVFAWGQNTRGQLGLGRVGHRMLRPRCVASLAGIPVAQLAAGGAHSFALSLSGAVFGWGRNNCGQLGLGDTKVRYLPTYVKLLEWKKIIYISCGAQHTALLSKGGHVFTCGSGSYGQLGHSTTCDEIKPRIINELLGSKVSQIACGSHHTLVLVASSGKVYSFGHLGKGQLGNGRNRHRLASHPVTFLIGMPDGGGLAHATLRQSALTTAKPVRIRGAQGALPKVTTRQPANGNRTQYKTRANRKRKWGDRHSKDRVPSAQPAERKEQTSSSIATHAESNMPDCVIQPVVRRIFAGNKQGFAMCSVDVVPVSPEDQSSFIPLKRIATVEDSLLDKWNATGDEELWKNIKEEINLLFSSAASINGSFLETSNDDHFKTSTASSGVDMSALTVWFEKLGKNPRLLQEVTTAVENKLIPSLTPSPVAVEALRVYLVLPELIDIQPEQSKVVGLTSLLSSAIASLEGNHLETLESWWSHLNEFFLEKLVTIYRSASYQLLRQTSSQQKEFPDELCNCLSILQRLYKVASSASFQIPENSFYIAAAEVFGDTLISCKALLQLIPYPCIFNMETKLKIFKILSHLQIRKGEIVDELITFGNNGIIGDPMEDAHLPSLEIHPATETADGNTNACNDDTDISTGITDASIGNIYASNCNVDMSAGVTHTGSIDTPTGNTDTPTGNTDTPTGNTDNPTGNTDNPTGNTDTPTGNTDTPTGNTDNPTGNADNPTGNTDTTTGNTDTPIGNTDTPTGNTDTPTGNTDNPTGNTITPTGNTDNPTGNTITPTGNTDNPTGNTDTTTGNTDTPTGNTDTPTGNTDNPTGNADNPTGNTDTTTGNTDTPIGNTDTPTGNTDTPTGNTDTPIGDTDTPTGNTDTPTGNTDALTRNIYISAGITDASTGSTDALTENIDPGNIGIAAQNVDISNENTDDFTGINRTSTGNLVAPNGNSDASTRDNVNLDEISTEGFCHYGDARDENCCTSNEDYYNFDEDDEDYYDSDEDYYNSDEDCYNSLVDYFDPHEETIFDHFFNPDVMALFEILASFQPKCHLFVDRTEILQNTLTQLRSCNDRQLRGSFKVCFKDESAFDYGGVSQEFFSVITEKLCTQPKTLKIYEESRLVWFPEWNPEIDDIFRLMGILCWLAVFHGFVADFHFPLALYKKLLNVKPTLDDLKDLSPTLGRNLQELLNYEDDDIEDIFCFNFTVGREMIDGTITEHELIPDGKNIPVNRQNRKQFVDCYVDYIFNTSVEKHFKAFSDGFRLAFPLPVVDLFLPVELMALIHGESKYDWQLLAEGTKYIGYSETDKIIVNFWEMFHGLTEEEKKRFLVFLTCCDRVPVGGMRSLRIVIHRDVRDEPDLYFPAAHTCSKTLDLPEYSSMEVLRERFLRAIGCSRVFGIQ